MQDYGELGGLMSARAVREKCGQIGELAVSGKSNWFYINDHNFSRCVKTVQHVCTKNYPDLKIPLHSRWRHFEIGDKDLWRHYTAEFHGDEISLARTAVDLVFVSVLLDAGAGPDWVFRDPVTGHELSRSEGLAAASIDLFFNRLANFHPAMGWSISPEQLESLTMQDLGMAMGHSDDNPLIGLDGRLALLHGLAKVVRQLGETEIDTGVQYTRPGNLVDECLAVAKKGLIGKPTIAAEDILKLVLSRFGGIWPSGYQKNGLNLGDCGFHSLLESPEVDCCLVPFHKLSQWLSYSLIEPMQMAGLKVSKLDGLTALPEYRNGGLLLDTGVLIPQDPDLLKSSFSLQSEVVVEWRALTIYIIDLLADKLRSELKMSADKLPLGAILQGGTWAAGRDLARKIRADGGPPIKLEIDGTIF